MHWIEKHLQTRGDRFCAPQQDFRGSAGQAGLTPSSQTPPAPTQHMRSLTQCALHTLATCSSLKLDPSLGSLSAAPHLASSDHCLLSTKHHWDTDDALPPPAWDSRQHRGGIPKPSSQHEASYHLWVWYCTPCSFKHRSALLWRSSAHLFQIMFSIPVCLNHPNQSHSLHPSTTFSWWDQRTSMDDLKDNSELSILLSDSRRHLHN